MMTDHGAFVLVHLYGPAVTDIEAERFPRKLAFYKVCIHLKPNCWASLELERTLKSLSGKIMQSQPKTYVYQSQPTLLLRHMVYT